MKPLKMLGIGLAVVSIMGLGASGWMFSNDATVVSNFIFQVLLGGSLVVFVSGIGLIFLSRNKEDPFKAAKEVLLDEPGENSPVAEKVITSSISVEATGISNPALSFEEEMALRKKRYFAESLGVAGERSVGQPVGSQPRSETPKSKGMENKPIASPRPVQKPAAEKIRIKLEWPFKKKPDPMRGLLDDEAKKAERQPQFRFD